MVPIYHKLMLKLEVPLGPILGELFFLIYINNLSNGLTSSPKLFGDDTSLLSFFSIMVFFHKHSRFTEQQGKRRVEGISWTPLHHFHPLHRLLDIRLAITAESSPLHITSSQNRKWNIWYSSASRWQLNFAPLIDCPWCKFSGK